MKTRINLYLPEFRPPKELLTLTRVILISLLALGLMVAWIFVARGQMAAQQKRNLDLTDRLTEVSDEVMQIQQKVAARSSSDQLEKDLERAKVRYEAKKKLADVMAGLKVDSDVSYSSLLMELAQVSSPNLAIESVSASGRVVTIRGKTSDASAVADFVEKFKNLDSLHKLSFASVSVGSEKDEKTGLLDFSLTGFDPAKMKARTGGSPDARK
ncbi:MAG: PilN domain-containing protein [Succinivibrionaceae bacterium]|nr:PilN domain-containing protein [Succinivibrionaceae bacterium]